MELICLICMYAALHQKQTTVSIPKKPKVMAVLEPFDHWTRGREAGLTDSLSNRV